MAVVITCEHASNHIPRFYEYLFVSATDDLNSHLGWDPNALDIAQYLTNGLGVELFAFEHSRLLIEVNRSLDHPQLFSKYTSGLDETERQLIINAYYLPYRFEVEKHVIDLINSGKQVVHVGVHTFTPDYFGVKRKVEIGLLFDPERPSEQVISDKWLEALAECDGQKVVCHNEPYAGKDDGFITFLRSKYPDQEYVGIELEVSQGFGKNNLEINDLILKSLMQTLTHLSDSHGAPSP